MGYKNYELVGEQAQAYDLGMYSYINSLLLFGNWGVDRKALVTLSVHFLR